LKPEYWALIKAIKISGNQSKLARKLGIKQQSISRWFKYGVPASRAHQIENITGGLIKATDLCEGANKDSQSA
tara:strand:+ start:535 stop:753 length:219 start_codon:yes stop_codon:yes gene_type:complete